MVTEGSLVQKYGQVVMGYLAEAIIKFKKSISGITMLENSIETAFGGLVIDINLAKEYQSPIITHQELISGVVRYLSNFKINFDLEIFESVIRDLVNLGILTTKGIRQIYAQNTIYSINTVIFEESGSKIEEQSVSLKDALNGRLERFLHHNEAREILTELSIHSLKSQVEISADLRKTAFFRDFGRGTLLTRLHSRGVKYSPFMETIELLSSSGIVTLGYGDDNNEFVVINSALKPFSILQKVLKGYRHGEPVEFIEVEVQKLVHTPFDKLIAFDNMLEISRDIFFFSKFDPYEFFPGLNK